MILIIKTTNSHVLNAIGLEYNDRERFDSMSQFCIQTNGSYSLIAQMATLGLIPGYCIKKRWEDIDRIKSETIERVSINFRTKFYLKNRCIIPVDGFVEYQYINETGWAKQKQFVTAADGKPIVIAGIWNQFNIRLTFCILTQPATGIMQEISNRGRNTMPMILSPGKYDDWLAGKPLEDFVADDVELKAEVVPWKFTYGLAK